MLKAKIHGATITETNLNYEGSLTIDEDLIEAAGMRPYEQVRVSNLNNGDRFETYIIPGPGGSGVICLNGPTARKGEVGDRIMIFSYCYYQDEDLDGFAPVIVRVDEKNRII
jgi:aspartate 1-decarboxylase